MAELQFIIFELGCEHYGINVLSIQEINRLKEMKINKVPNAEPFIKGIINLRGDVVPIIELRILFGINKKEIDKQTRVIILTIGKKQIGILVDRVLRVVTVDDSKICQTPEEVKIGSECVSSICKVDDNTAFLLDVNKMFDYK